MKKLLVERRLLPWRKVLGPALAAPIVAGLGGYSGLYALTAVVTLLGRVLVWKIKSAP